MVKSVLHKMECFESYLKKKVRACRRGVKLIRPPVIHTSFIAYPQYFSSLPFASITASSLLRMLRYSLNKCSADILFDAFITAFFKSAMFSYCFPRLYTSFAIKPHTFSIIFTSGDFAGHGEVRMPFFCIKIRVSLDL